MVIWYDNQYFENGRSTLFTKGNCQHQNKQKNLFSRMRCSVLCSLWQFVYRSSRKYHFSSPESDNEYKFIVARLQMKVICLFSTIYLYIQCLFVLSFNVLLTGTVFVRFILVLRKSYFRIFDLILMNGKIFWWWIFIY